MACLCQRGQKPLVPQTHPSAHGLKGDGGDGHDAKAAQLDQEEDAALAKRTEIHLSINHGQAGDADRAHRGERGVNERELLGCGGPGEVQKHGSEQAESEKGAD